MRLTCLSIVVLLLLAFSTLAREEVPELVLTDVSEDHPRLDREQLDFWLKQLEGGYHRIRIVQINPQALLSDIARAAPHESRSHLGWRTGGMIRVSPFPDREFLLRNTIIDPNQASPYYPNLWSWAGNIIEAEPGYSGIFIIRHGHLAAGYVHPPQSDKFQFQHINDDFYLIYESNYRERISKMTPEQLREISDDMRWKSEDGD